MVLLGSGKSCNLGLKHFSCYRFYLNPPPPLLSLIIWEALVSIQKWLLIFNYVNIRYEDQCKVYLICFAVTCMKGMRSSLLYFWGNMIWKRRRWFWKYVIRQLTYIFLPPTQVPPALLLRINGDWIYRFLLVYHRSPTIAATGHVVYSNWLHWHN